MNSTIAFNAKKIKKLIDTKIPDGKTFIEYRDTSIQGLTLRVGKRSSTYYFVSRSKGKKAKRFKLGRTDEISLAEAQKKSLDLKAERIPVKHDYERTRLKQYIMWHYFKQPLDEKQLHKINFNYPLFHMAIGEITKHDIQCWIDERKSTNRIRSHRTKNGELIRKETEKQISYGTVKREYNIIRAALNSAVDRSHLTNNPATRIKIQGDDSAKRSPIPEMYFEEYQRLVRQLKNEDLQLFLVIMMSTGARPKEVLTIKLENIDFLDFKITVPASFSKTKKTRTLHFTRTLANYLIRYLTSNHKTTDLKTYTKRPGNDEGWLFFNPKTKTRFYSFYKSYRKAVEGAGLKYYSLYHLRHTFASKLMEKNVDTASIMEALGHTNLSTTEIYVKSLENNVEKAVVSFADDLNL